MGPTETLIADRAATGTLSSYVNASGQVRVRVRCTRSGSFILSSNLLRLTYTRA